MLSRESIKSYLSDLVDVNCEAFRKYLNLCINMNEAESDKYNFHHTIPVSSVKIKNGLNDRYKAIDLTDELFPPKDNVVKIPVLVHVLVHYWLFKASSKEINIQAYEDNRRAFAGFMLENKAPEDFTYEEVLDRAMYLQKQAPINYNTEYLTKDQRNQQIKDFKKQQQQEYYDQHKEEIECRKKEQLAKAREYQHQQYLKMKGKK